MEKTKTSDACGICKESTSTDRAEFEGRQPEKKDAVCRCSVYDRDGHQCGGDETVQLSEGEEYDQCEMCGKETAVKPVLVGFSEDEQYICKQCAEDGGVYNCENCDMDVVGDHNCCHLCNGMGCDYCLHPERDD